MKIKSLLLALACGALPLTTLSVSTVYGQQFGFARGGASGGGSASGGASGGGFSGGGGTSGSNYGRGGTVSSSSSSSSSSGASGGSSSGGSSNGLPFQRSQTRSNSSTSRSVSVQEDGQNITVAEDNSGITVTIASMVDGVEKKRVVKAANPRRLEAKDSEAARLYHKHLGANGPKANARATARASGLNTGGFDGAPVDAQNLLRQQLLKQIDENANNPQIQELLRQSLQSLDNR